jgi:hypothetical protein
VVAQNIGYYCDSYVSALTHHGAAGPPAIAGQKPLQPRPLAARIVMNRVDGGADSDTATARTVAMMGAYILKCSTDPQVVAAAQYARNHFAAGPDAAGLAWGVFWYVKHCVKFRQDEATMFRLGFKDEVDFLTAPDVLVRMNDPAEDCDGFTMLVASMLTALGVPVAIATVAASADDPTRWSHVFALALLPGGRVLPLDASHGIGPGWMVPARDVFRFQAWNLQGQPIEVKMPRRSGLQGYVKRGGRGLGDLCLQDPTSGDMVDATTGGPCVVSPPVVYTPPVGAHSGICVGGMDTGDGTPCIAPTSTAIINPIAGTAPPNPANVPVATAPVNFATALTSLAAGITRALSPAPAVGTTTYNPATGLYTTVGANGVVTTSSVNPAAGVSSLLSSPLLLAGGLALAVFLFASQGKRR